MLCQCNYFKFGAQKKSFPTSMMTLLVYTSTRQLLYHEHDTFLFNKYFHFNTIPTVFSNAVIM
jgi:hypothetical protein